MIRVGLPYHLRNLAGVQREVQLSISAPATIVALLDALEEQYPVLRGTIRDQHSGQRRPFIRFFACSRDWSLEPLDTPLPAAVLAGSEAFMIVGAIAGGLN